ncbi:MAG: DUF6164 family protein [Gammaproteobacteria bacterium]|nr:hypothetical protein [Pseudomonadales bacterium]MCP5347559.1 hypothetical protein [Pseudomonadales bacterium]
MAVLLFKLRHVPDDEADEVRALLEEHGIAFYETSAGNWRISMPALWLQDESQLREARSLLDRYQQDRSARARQEYLNLKQTGQHQTLWKNFIREPIRVSLYLGGALVILYLSLQAFLSLGQGA